SKALSIVEELIANANEMLDNKQKDKIPQIAANLALVARILGVGLKDSFEYFKLGVSEARRVEIEALIAKRTEYKKAKDFANADKIREDLRVSGIEIMDTPQGCEWEKV
ncbi:MAG: cysteine--tRNA ligase, partial [Helicobacter sp.]|nr:cysteine--tRNA ligase [Helicobacter sp.]